MLLPSHRYVKNHSITPITNVTFSNSASSFDPDLAFYRKVLYYTEDEIDRDREAAMLFFRDTYGLDFTNIEQGQRILDNATFEPGRSPFNLIRFQQKMQHLNPIGVLLTSRMFSTAGC